MLYSIKRYLAVTGLALSLCIAAATADAAIYMRIDGIEGAVNDGPHKGAIEILSYSWGATNTGAHGAGGGGGAGKVSVHDISISKVTDKASPKLFEHVCTGKIIPRALLTVTKGGRAGEPEQTYLTVTLSDCLISSYQSGGENDSLPAESLSLNFSKIEYKVFFDGPDGRASTSATYDHNSSRSNKTGS
jgi:type VI secretion system secreted protein Hcp